jgi:DNA-binding NarL/FixJ family response regulator
MTTAARNKVILIESSPVLRAGLRSLLENAAFRIIAEYSAVDELQNDRHRPDVDLLLINPDAACLHKSFNKTFNIRTLLSAYPQAAAVAVVAGYVNAESLDTFDGSVDIYSEPAQIVRRLRHILQSFDVKDNPVKNIELSEREKEILTAVAKGLSNKEIADQHCISVHTVVSHRKNITRKTAIRTVAGLTLYAVFNNLISQEDLQN